MAISFSSFPKTKTLLLDYNSARIRLVFQVVPGRDIRSPRAHWSKNAVKIGSSFVSPDESVKLTQMTG
jgi:hypothetical protein